MKILAGACNSKNLMAPFPLKLNAEVSSLSCVGKRKTREHCLFAELGRKSKLKIEEIVEVTVPLNEVPATLLGDELSMGIMRCGNSKLPLIRFVPQPPPDGPPPDGPPPGPEVPVGNILPVPEGHGPVAQTPVGVGTLEFAKGGGPGAVGAPPGALGVRTPEDSGGTLDAPGVGPPCPPGDCPGGVGPPGIAGGT